ncbi:MAG: DUF4340 domain-containing protein [Treponema sp.]|nr:DUF4340 domain-containing protein [Treponema sp.]MBQ6567294.1 DUF4340 domain-containing protein [Treponema sp.]MBQ7165632.1 DUF4340 domain-containing protein [Treponema sp.]
MRRLSKAQGILFFYIFDLALLLLLILSFLPFMRRRGPSAKDTALLNPAHKDKVFRIELSQGGGGIFSSGRKVCLEKAGGIWLGSSSDGNGEFVWPADMQAVDKLLELASSVIRSYEKSSSRKDWGKFGITDGEAFSLSFYDSSQKTLSYLYFGGDDPLTGRIYVRSASDVTVYELDAGIQPYLTADESFWADPFLYPQCLTGLGRAEAEEGLRRGKLENIRPREGLEADYSGRLYFGNGAEILFRIYKKESSYIVIPALTPGLAASDEERAAISRISYRYGISGLTLGNLLEELRQAE